MLMIGNDDDDEDEDDDDDYDDYDLTAYLGGVERRVSRKQKSL